MSERLRRCVGLCVLSLVMLVFAEISFAQGGSEELVVLLGQSKMIDYPNPIKRVSIPATDIADAAVITPTQLLLTGKQAGITSLVVWDEREMYQIYKLIVREDRTLSQINLKVRVAEVSETALHELGIDFWYKGVQMGDHTADFGVFSGKVNAPSDPLALADVVDAFFTISDLNISAILKALEQKNLVSVLAKPNLTAIDGTEASFLAGGEFPVPIVSGSSGMQMVSIMFKEFGVRLKFTPHVLDDKAINIKVAAEVSSLDFENGVILSGFSIPSLVTRKAETTVEVPQGKFLLIGGLLSNDKVKTVSNLPILGKIPILGKLFSSSRFQNKESELLIFITPEVVNAVNESAVPEVKKLKF